eukprot:13755687-Alexandrium_andersonii.AAC.1
MASSTTSARAPRLAAARRRPTWTLSSPTTRPSTPTHATSTLESKRRTAGRRPCLSPPVRSPAHT